VSHAALVGAARVTLFAVPGKQPVAELTVTADGPQVDVIERRGAQAHVMVPVQSLNPLDDVILVGWIPASLLRPRESGFGGSWGSGGVPAIPAQPRRRDARTVACAREVPLVAELGGERRLVGMLAAEVPIEFVPDGRSEPEDLVDVLARTAGVTLALGARLLAKRSELAGCTDVRGRTW
jgi:hypothetical protein